MRKLKMQWFFLVLMILLLITTFAVTRRRFPITHEDCIKPFHEFAYSPADTSQRTHPRPPGPPWQLEAIIPGQENATYSATDIQASLARTKDGREEIWLFKAPFDSWVGTVNREGSFVIYYPESQTWAEVSALIADTNLVVSKLFVTSDGTIWGLIDTHQPHTVPVSGPVLGRFNELTRQFEAANGGLEISMIANHQLLAQTLKVVLDKEDIFWLFGPHDSIYRYDPNNQTLERQAALPRARMERIVAAVATDGSIFFQDKSLNQTGDFLFRFFPATREIIAIDVPRKPWEATDGMLVDRKGRLWLGAMGYMDPDGSWHLLHPDAPKIWENRSQIPWWSPPALQLESSNGLLWYLEFHDMEGVGEGTAWYNPETDEGCLFTNLPGYLVEDDVRQVWMAAGGKLYRYPLEQSDLQSTAGWLSDFKSTCWPAKAAGRAVYRIIYLSLTPFVLSLQRCPTAGWRVTAPME